LKTSFTYNTIEDFLISQPMTVDVEIDDEWSGCFSIKGIEFPATILYAGMSDFSRISVELSSAEVLIYVNMFLSWMRDSAENQKFCVIQRFLDNALLLVFSARFGSEDPFSDALNAARWMGEHDSMKFCPNIGIASGTVTAGFTGTPKEYGASVFGKPVILAAGCSRLKPKGTYASSITFPAEEWGTRNFSEVFPPVEFDHPEKGRVKQPQTWQLGDPRMVEFPGIGEFAVQDIANFIHWMPKTSAELKAREWFGLIKSKGYYKKT
jgi:class 3 adenylate cyclase